jgi:hypothetical protein
MVLYTITLSIVSVHHYVIKQNYTHFDYIQHNNSRHYVTQQSDYKFNFCFTDYKGSPECYYRSNYYRKCRYAIILRGVKLSVVLVSIAMLSVIIFSVIILNVVAPATISSQLLLLIVYFTNSKIGLIALKS